MVQLAAKIVLADKQAAKLPVGRVTANLKWTANVDLDLMCFYEAKNGDKGGVFSPHINGGIGRGSLLQFPFMELSGDAGVGATGGDNVETVTMANFDDMKRVYIVALNYTAAKEAKTESFANYDGLIELFPENGDSLAIRLTDPTPGHACVIGQIDNSTGTPELLNLNSVITIDKLVAEIPGAIKITSTPNG